MDIERAEFFKGLNRINGLPWAP